MARLLIISDIHGNFPALEAVLKKSSPQNYDLVLNAGDSIVYAPFTNETLNALSNLEKQISILGNTDLKVLQLLNGKEFKKPGKPEKRFCYLSASKEISPENIAFLHKLSKSVILNIEGKKIILCHGSPSRFDEHLFPSTPNSKFRKIAEKHNADIIIFGHSHVPFLKNIDGTLFLNPGSVGRPFDGNWLASYAELEISSDFNPKVNFQRCEYDLEMLIKRLKISGFAPLYERMYRQGRKLN